MNEKIEYNYVYIKFKRKKRTQLLSDFPKNKQWFIFFFNLNPLMTQYHTNLKIKKYISIHTTDRKSIKENIKTKKYIRFLKTSNSQ